MPEKNHWLLRTNLVVASKMPSTKMCLGSSLEQVKHRSAFWLRIVLREGGIIIYICCICNMFFFGEASPHTSTPNVSSVHHADSRGSLVSTDSGNSLLDKNSDKTNSLEKVASYINHNSPPQNGCVAPQVLTKRVFIFCHFLLKQLIILFLLSFAFSLILGFFDLLVNSLIQLCIDWEVTMTTRLGCLLVTDPFFESMNVEQTGLNWI